MPWSSQTLDRFDLKRHPRRRALVLLLPLVWGGMFISPSVAAAPGYAALELKLSTPWTVALCTISGLILARGLTNSCSHFRTIRRIRGTNDIDSLCIFFGSFFTISVVVFSLAVIH